MQPAESALLHKYDIISNSTPHDLIGRRKVMNILSQHGVVINDPQVDHYLLSRAISQLIREAKSNMTIAFSEISDLRVTKQILDKVKSGVKVSILCHHIDDASLRLIHKELKLSNIGIDDLLSKFRTPHEDAIIHVGNLKLVCQSRVSKDGKGLPYLHQNVLSVDDGKKVYAGTGYSWSNMNFNRILPDGPSFEIGIVASNQLASDIHNDLHDNLRLVPAYS